MINPITITRLARAMRRFGITFTDYAILCAVAPCTCSIPTIVSKLGISAPTIRNAVTRLQKNEYIYTERDESNWRNLIHISPIGIRLLQDIENSL